MSGWWRDARGSGTVLAVAIMGACLALTTGLCLALGAFAVQARVTVAADAAALAAADTASGRIPGDPCARAAAVAAAHESNLVGCEAGRSESFVTVTAEFGAFTLGAVSRAGLPP